MQPKANCLEEYREYISTLAEQTKPVDLGFSGNMLGLKQNIQQEEFFRNLTLITPRLPIQKRLQIAVQIEASLP